MWKQGQVVQEEYSNTVSECRARGRKTKASPSRGHRWQQEELLSALKEMAGKCRPTTKWGEETSWQRTRNKSGYPMGSSWSLSIRLAFNIFTALDYTCTIFKIHTTCIWQLKGWIYVSHSSLWICSWLSLKGPKFRGQFQRIEGKNRKCCPQEGGNYRLVSLTSLPGNVIEKINLAAISKHSRNKRAIRSI